MIRKTLICVVLALAALTLACPKRTSIADVTARPEKFRDKSIAVAGVVKESYGLSIPGTRMGGGLYKLDDGTGSLWIVVSEGTVPPKDAEIGVQGRVSTGVTWSGRNYGLGLHEEKRRYR
jgi:hypothetical protein